jgi:hypothetical protein
MLLFSLCCSSGWSKAIWHYRMISSTGMTLVCRGNSASKKFQGLEVQSLQDSLHCSTLGVLGDVIPKILPYVWFSTDAPTRTKFQQFASNTPLSSFKKLIVSTSRLPCKLHTTCLTKAVTNGLKDCKCEKITFHECLLIPYIPKKYSI